MTLHRTIIMTMKWNMMSLLALLPLKTRRPEEETETGNVTENTSLPESIAIVRAVSMPDCKIHTQVFTTNSTRISLLLLIGTNLMCTSGS